MWVYRDVTVVKMCFVLNPRMPAMMTCGTIGPQDLTFQFDASMDHTIYMPYEDNFIL